MEPNRKPLQLWERVLVVFLIGVVAVLLWNELKEDDKGKKEFEERGFSKVTRLIKGDGEGTLHVYNGDYYGCRLRLVYDQKSGEFWYKPASGKDVKGIPDASSKKLDTLKLPELQNCR